MFRLLWIRQYSDFMTVENNVGSNHIGKTGFPTYMMIFNFFFSQLFLKYCRFCSPRKWKIGWRKYFEKIIYSLTLNISAAQTSFWITVAGAMVANEIIVFFCFFCFRQYRFLFVKKFLFLRRGICLTKSNINWQPPLRGSLWGGGELFSFFWLLLIILTSKFFSDKNRTFLWEKKFFSMENQKWLKNRFWNFKTSKK